MTKYCLTADISAKAFCFRQPARSLYLSRKLLFSRSYLVIGLGSQAWHIFRFLIKSNSYFRSSSGLRSFQPRNEKWIAACGSPSSPWGFHAGGLSLRLGEDTGHEKMKTIYPSIPFTFEPEEM